MHRSSRSFVVSTNVVVLRRCCRCLQVRAQIRSSSFVEITHPHRWLGSLIRRPMGDTSHVCDSDGFISSVRLGSCPGHAGVGAGLGGTGWDPSIPLPHMHPTDRSCTAREHAFVRCAPTTDEAWARSQGDFVDHASQETW